MAAVEEDEEEEAQNGKKAKGFKYRRRVSADLTARKERMAACRVS
jgi:hypothetical protein